MPNIEKLRFDEITDYWGVTRNVVSYILLHTYYRPRDLLFFLNSIVQVAVRDKPAADHIESQDVLEGTQTSLNEQAGRPDQTPVSLHDSPGYVQFAFALPSTHFVADDLVMIHPVFWRYLELGRPRELVRGVIEPGTSSC